MIFADQSRYNRLFLKVIHKVGESALYYDKIFHDAKDLEITAGNIYSVY